MSYVVFTNNSKFMTGQSMYSTAYWTGEFRANGRGSKTIDTRKALKFETAREAYEAAGAHKSLQSWRVKKL